MKNIPFIKYSKLWVGITVVVVVFCLGCLLKFGLKPGLDFTGGSLMELEFSGTVPTADQMHTVLSGLGLNNSVVQGAGDKGMIVRTAFLNETEHQKLYQEIKDKLSAGKDVRESRFETIGASVSSQLKKRSLLATIFVSIGIVLYIAYAFRKVSKPVASWKYGLLAIIALIHDLLLVVGVFALLGRFAGVEVDTAFVVALLTILGYSVNDTIVVFDRVRENLLRRGSNEEFGDVVNKGLNQTLARSINTTLTTLLPLFVLYFFGGPTIHNFVLALLIGVASGAYSSIFIASPLLALVEKWQRA